MLFLRSEDREAFERWTRSPRGNRIRTALAGDLLGALEGLERGDPDSWAGKCEELLDPRAAAFQALLPIRRDAVLLDLGSGLGTVARALAGMCGLVVALESAFETLLVAAAANDRRGAGRVVLAYGGPRDLERFQATAFDGVVLEKTFDDTPREEHAGILAACRRLLKPGGWLYAAAPRRGRESANRPRGLRALLRRSGFSKVDLYGVLPEAKGCRRIFPLPPTSPQHGAAGELGIVRRWKVRLAERPLVVGRLTPWLGAAARLGEVGWPPWLADLGADPNRAIDHIHVKRDQASIWYRARDRTIRVREVALAETAARRLTRIGGLVEALAPCARRILSLDGWTLARGSGYLWSDRPALPGRTLDQAPHGKWERELDRLSALLLAVHELGTSLAGEALDLAACARDYTTGFARLAPQDRAAFEELVAWLDRESPRGRLLIHGDVTPANVLLSSSRLALIDWEWSRLVAFAGYDILKFLWFDTERPSHLDHVWKKAAFTRRLADSAARDRFELLHPGVGWEPAVLGYYAIRVARQMENLSTEARFGAWVEAVLRPSLRAAREVAGLPAIPS